MKMNYYKSKENQVYAYTDEDIAKVKRLSELETQLDSKKEKLLESESHLNTSKEKYAKSNDELYQLSVTESDGSEIAIAKEKLITAGMELEKSLSDFKVAEKEYLEVKRELDSIQDVFRMIRDNMSEMHKMTQKEIDAHLNPPKSKEQHIAEAEAKKQSFLAEANIAIALLQDAVDLDMATDEESALLKEWKKYRVLLNRVDTSAAPDIEFPEKPAK